MLRGGVFGVGLKQEGGFGESQVAGPRPCLLDPVKENHEEVEDGVTEEPKFGGGPPIERGSRMFCRSAVFREGVGGEVAEGVFFSLVNMLVIFGEEFSGKPRRVGGVPSVDGAEGVDNQLIHLGFVGDVDGISFLGIGVFEVGEGSRHLAQTFVSVAHVASEGGSPFFDSFSLVGSVEAVEKLVEMSGEGGELQNGAVQGVVGGSAKGGRDGVKQGVESSDVELGGWEVLGVVEYASDGRNVQHR